MRTSSHFALKLLKYFLNDWQGVINRVHLGEGCVVVITPNTHIIRIHIDPFFPPCLLRPAWLACNNFHLFELARLNPQFSSVRFGSAGE